MRDVNDETGGDCRVCGKPTNVIFNINLKRASICESCANSIAWQQLESLMREKNARLWYEELTHGFQITEEFLIEHDKRESDRKPLSVGDEEHAAMCAASTKASAERKKLGKIL